ncbi:elongation factor 1-beta [archaeon]|nr:elongation factor 1-beta [archaeon]
MAQVIITFKIMPESLEIELKKLENEAKEMITKFGGDVGKTEKESIAFGLQALRFVVVFDEAKGGTDFLEDNLRNLDGVSSVEVVDVRRAIG